MDQVPQLQPRPSLLGMRLYGPPLSDVTVQFGPALTAFYGRNGAGKTSILNGLRNAFAGRTKYITQLIMQADSGSVAFEWVVRSIKETARDLPYKLKYEGTDADVIGYAIRSWFLSGGRHFDPSLSEDEIKSAFVHELAELTSIAILPAGGEESSWDVWLCMPPQGSGSPAIEGAVARLVNLWNKEDERETLLLAKEEQLEAQFEAGEITEGKFSERQDEIEVAWEEIGKEVGWGVFEPVAGFAWDFVWSDDADSVRRFISRMLGDGLPVPVVKLFSTKTMPFELEDDEDDSDLDRVTAVKLMARLDSRPEEEKAAQDTDELLRRWVQELETEVNTIYSTLLQDAPTLTLKLSHPSRWLAEKPVQWIVRYGHEAVPLISLSRAERRWARIAIRRALDFNSLIAASVIDEPEAALHRAAERHMSGGLEALTAFGPQLILATHSPEVLNSSATKCVHVSKTEGKTRVGQVPDLRPESLAVLGLSPSDLLGLYRIFLLVEGVHDEIVLRAFCGPALDEARVKIIPMHGGRNLPGSIESQVLFDLTDAHLVAVLDDIRIHEVNDVWNEAVKLWQSNEQDLAMTRLTSAFRGRKGSEYEWITNWLGRALKHQVHSRIEPYGFRARDIIEYLPVEVMVPEAEKSWDDLRREHDQAIPSLDKRKGLHNFKQWLSRTYKADISVSAISRGAEAATDVPEEFQKFSYRIREIGSRSRAGR
ncbi:ATP-binding protein [Arthrobacter sp. 49Tsu3.1M3]|uniref:ATP-binding protein n=1 Tax=Arthrobacter sp. 49Tsu3.1M3 TaxID=1279029 RepID=UPI0009A6DC1E|nr:ATP-binding protein [Arthrobacter sp. 49Tsu3.1M3]